MDPKSEAVDLEKILKTGTAVLEGEQPAPSVRSISEQVEHVRYAEEQRLSSAGQAVLKDLEEILSTGAEASEAIPPETFLHAARAQQAAKQLRGMEEEAEAVGMDLMMIVRMLVTSAKFRDMLGHWFEWISAALQQKAEKEAQREGEGEMEVMAAEKERQAVDRVAFQATDELMVLLEGIQDQPEYQNALGYLCELVQLLSDSLLGEMEAAEESVSEQAKEDAEKLQDVVNKFKLTAMDALKAIETWTNEDFGELPKEFSNVYMSIRKDRALIGDITALGHFLRSCFAEEGFLNDRQWIRDEARNRINSLKLAIDQGGHRLRFNELSDRLQSMLSTLKSEPKTTKLKESLRKLLEDLFVVEEGRGEMGGLLPWRLKTELIGDLGVLLGDLARKVRFLRVPDIEIHDDDLSFAAQNIILDAKELLPQQFKLTLVTENMTEREQQAQTPHADPAMAPLPEPEDSTWISHLKFECKGIRGHCRNVHFNMQKKTGFPQMTDEGTADFRVWGRQGMLIKLVLRPDWVYEHKQTVVTEQVIEKRAPVGLATLAQAQVSVPITSGVSSVSAANPVRKLKLSVIKARCVIDELDLDLHGTRRDWFYSILAPLVRHRVKSAMEKAVERNLFSLMD